VAGTIAPSPPLAARRGRRSRELRYPCASALGRRLGRKCWSARCLGRREPELAGVAGQCRPVLLRRARGVGDRAVVKTAFRKGLLARLVRVGIVPRLVADFSRQFRGLVASLPGRACGLSSWAARRSRAARCWAKLGGPRGRAGRENSFLDLAILEILCNLVFEATLRNFSDLCKCPKIMKPLLLTF
jgi:hypothetical protein